MQSVIIKEVKIISDWQMYQDCGVSIHFIEEDIYGGFSTIYFSFSIKKAKEDAKFYMSGEEKNLKKVNEYNTIVNYFQSLGFSEDEEILIRID